MKWSASEELRTAERNTTINYKHFKIPLYLPNCCQMRVNWEYSRRWTDKSATPRFRFRQQAPESGTCSSFPGLPLPRGPRRNVDAVKVRLSRAVFSIAGISSARTVLVPDTKGGVSSVPVRATTSHPAQILYVTVLQIVERPATFPQLVSSNFQPFGRIAIQSSNITLFRVRSWGRYHGLDTKAPKSIH